MADDRLKNFVLSLADTDYTLSEQVRLVVLAALEGSQRSGRGTRRRRHLIRTGRIADRCRGGRCRTGRCLPALDHRAGLPRDRGAGDASVPARARTHRGGGPQRLGQVDAGRGARTRADGHQLTLERQGSGVVAELAQSARRRSRAHPGRASPKKAPAQQQSASTGQPAKASMSTTSRRGCSGTARSVRTPACWAGPVRWRCTGRC